MSSKNAKRARNEIIKRNKTSMKSDLRPSMADCLKEQAMIQEKIRSGNTTSSSPKKSGNTSDKKSSLSSIFSSLQNLSEISNRPETQEFVKYATEKLDAINETISEDEPHKTDSKQERKIEEPPKIRLPEQKDNVPIIVQVDEVTRAVMEQIMKNEKAAAPAENEDSTALKAEVEQLRNQLSRCNERIDELESTIRRLQPRK